MDSHDEHGPEGPPMSKSASRRWARRAMLSALTGGGLTAVGLGGALPGGALAADAPAATGAGEETPPPATETTTTSSAQPTQQSGSSEPTTTTSTTVTESTTTSAPVPTSAPSPAPAQSAPSAAAGPPGGGEAQEPKVVKLRKQQSVPPKRPRKGSRAGGKLGTVKGAGGQTGGAQAGGVGANGANGAGGAGGPTTVPAGTPNGVAPPPLAVAGQAGTLASLIGSSAVSAQALSYYRIPLFLLPIYQAAGIQYGVPWQILAAINEVETNYGTDLNVSTAGAVGWMQFMPTTWMQYGVDALGAGYADPYNPVDAIFAAARYLHAAGASSNLHTAILAYNHSEAYVSSVLLRAKLIAAYPQSVIATLTGLTQGSLPVAGARLAQDPSAPLPTVASATAGATPLAPYVNAGSGSSAAASGSAAPGATPGIAPSTPGDTVNVPTSLATAPAPFAAATKATSKQHTEELRFADLLGPVGAPVTAVQDGRIVKLGHSHKLGNYLALRDVYGDVFTYAGMGSIAPSYPVVTHPLKAKQAKATVKSPVHEPAPTKPASAGRQPTTLHLSKHSAPPVGADEAQSTGGEGAEESPVAAPPPGMARVRLYAHPGNPVARVAATRAAVQGSSGAGHGGKWRPLRLGSLVSQGTILGHLSKTPIAESAVGAEAAAAGTAGGGAAGAAGSQAASPLQGWSGAHVRIPVSAQSARLRFAIRPSGDSGTIDPRPILANWRQLDTALHPKGARKDVNLLGSTVAQVFLMSTGELERTVLSDPGINIYECGRQDIASGAIDGRVLAVLEFLSRSGLKPTVSALRCGHSEMTTSGNVSEHWYGDAVDISEINGVPIAGHQGAGSITDVTIRALLTLQGRFVPHQIISLMQYPEAANTLALPDHWNHIHVGFRPEPGTLAPSIGPGANVGTTTAGTTAAAHSAGAGQTAPSPQSATAPLTVTGNLTAAQWNELVARIGSLQAPTVSAKPSSSAIRDPQAAATNRDLGARALPSGGAEE
jgi:Transglycosylase SLT domain